MNLLYEIMESPVGPLTLTASEAGLCRVDFGPRSGISAARQGSCSLLQQAKQQLEEYFAGQRRVFSVPLSLTGTDFQKKVWYALADIPYGETRSYGDLARAIGHPGACRAVGGANHRNPVSIILPCHRVIGSDKSLTGYGGGLAIKEFLLKLEGAL
ncbi:MAG: methylated-DNA--[protein]-cysteine S-methyltransferase [Oscillospiraceae bacterium]|nr:methylated-DNA--[protein]-cysteine S-methyltransferase [Oscillospiraceae bacterium]